MMDTFLDFSKIIIADLILSGDNALVIGMAAACLAPELRKRAILYGMMIAAILRIIFAVVATELLAVPGLLFVGSLLLFWVCWRLYQEIREQTDARAEAALAKADDAGAGYTGPPRRTLLSALISITLAKLLTRFPVISWLGLVVLLYVAGEMLLRGFFDADLGVGPMLGLVNGWAMGGH